ncbi:MAG: hypothetical protein HFI49_00955 [Bacilli bacterium]|jgi:hypothetical protein|nr:hypothetical protein [Bacilli bacterium]
MKINNKIESIKMIEELKLNKFPEKLFKKGDEEKVIEFINEYPAEYYAIRDKSKPKGIFKLAVTKNKILEEIKEYEMYTINVSSYNYANNQVLVGEIEVLSNNDIYLICSATPGDSVRDAIKNPDYNLKTNIFDRKLNNIPYFNCLYEYVINNNLIDIIVEFAIFNIKIGIKKENIIIYELRTNY